MTTGITAKALDQLRNALDEAMNQPLRCSKYFVLADHSAVRGHTLYRCVEKYGHPGDCTIEADAL